MGKPYLPLVEVQDFKWDLCEEITDNYGNKQMKVGGRFQHADLKNANGRIYPFALLEREVGKNQEKISKRQMLGELDHPADGSSSAKRVSHIITKLELKGKEVYGEYETVDTACGNDLKALLRANAGIGISSRGSGHVVNKGDVYEVADDFVLQTFDAVIDPSTPGAYPTLLSEQIITLVEVDAKLGTEELLNNFHQVMKLKGLTGLKFQETNVDAYLEAYKEFIKQDLTPEQYKNLRRELVARNMTNDLDQTSHDIMKYWNAALAKVKIAQ